MSCGMLVSRPTPADTTEKPNSVRRSDLRGSGAKGGINKPRVSQAGVAEPHACVLLRMPAVPCRQPGCLHAWPIISAADASLAHLYTAMCHREPCRRLAGLPLLLHCACKLHHSATACLNGASASLRRRTLSSADLVVSSAWEQGLASS